jgi:hypothetical protein
MCSRKERTILTTSASSRRHVVFACLIGFSACQARQEVPALKEAREREERQILARQHQEVRAARQKAIEEAQAKADAQCPPFYASWRKAPNPEPQGEEERSLVEHVKQSIKNAHAEQSKISQDVLNVEGMSSPRIRHLLNNLGSWRNTSYLEVGLWKGSTFVSTLFANDKSVTQAIGIENWGEFNGLHARPAFKANVAKLLAKRSFTVLEQDCFTVDKAKFAKKVSLYLYDGDHSMEAHKKGMTYFADVLASPAVILVDDWNRCQERQGTYDGFTEERLSVIYEDYLPKVQGFWEGFYAAVVRKSSEPAGAKEKRAKPDAKKPAPA